MNIDKNERTKRITWVHIICMYIQDNPDSDIRYTDIMTHINTIRLGRAPKRELEKKWANRLLANVVVGTSYQVWKSAKAAEECKSSGCKKGYWGCSHTSHRRAHRTNPRGHYYQSNKQGHFYLTYEGREKAREARKLIQDLNLCATDTIVRTCGGSTNKRHWSDYHVPLMIEQIHENGLAVTAMGPDGNEVYVSLPQFVKIL